MREKIVESIISFMNKINDESIAIDVEEIDFRKMPKVFNGKIDTLQMFVDFTKEEIKQKKEIEFNEANDYWLYIIGAHLYWTRMGREGKGSLAGGFYINGATMIFLTDQQKFWERSEMAFDRFDNKAALLDDPRHLSWFESTTGIKDPLSTPYFGCTKIKNSADLDEFYFYDSGKLYDLPFKSVKDYFSAMFSTAAVECWQYFFIPPEVIIEKNKGLPYITWNLHYRSELEDGIKLLQYNPSIQYDRLDLINEYLERCVTLLPKSFPYLDFSHHIEYYEGFKSAYERSKTN